jgi:hypothetical protein
MGLLIATAGSFLGSANMRVQSSDIKPVCAELFALIPTSFKRQLHQLAVGSIAGPE